MPLVLEELAGCLSVGESVEETYDRQELLAAIHTFLRSQSAKKRSIFVRRYWYADSVGDIAVRYGMRPGGVSMTLSRMRAQLHDYLLERGFAV